MGEQDNLDVGVSEDVYLTLSKGALSNLKAVLETQGDLTAPIRKGDKVGDVIYVVDDKEVARTDLVALNNVEEGGFFKRMLDWVKRLVASWF